MSAQPARELPRRTGTAEAGAPRERTRVFTVRTTSHADDETEVLAAANLPTIGAAHPGDAGIFCKRRQANEEKQLPGGGSKWIVTCEYKQPGFGGSPQKRCSEVSTDNPLDEPWTVDWDTVEDQEPLPRAVYLGTYDQDGAIVATTGQPTIGSVAPVVNSAGQPFIEPLMADRGRLTATISVNLADFDPADAMDWMDAVNANPFSIRGKLVFAGQAKVRRVGARELFYGECYRYHAVTLTIDFKRDGWNADLRDEGYAQLNAGGDDVVELQDENGQRISEPQLLNGSGAALPPDSTAAVYRRFGRHDEISYSALPIPAAA